MWLLLLWQTTGDAEAIRFGVVTVLLPLLLMSNLLFTVGFVVAERTLYIPRSVSSTANQLTVSFFLTVIFVMANDLFSFSLYSSGLASMFV